MLQQALHSQLKLAYVYRHIRLDKNEPFYIGIGGETTSPNPHFRSTCKYSRNRHWTGIVKLYGFKVDIILDDLTWEEACLKEIEFIALYGRADLGKGPLVNMTDGGEGIQNVSKETKDKKSKSMILFHETHPGFFKEKANTRNFTEMGMKVSLNRNHKAAGAKVSLTRKNNPEIGINIGKKNSKPVLQYDLEGNFIREYSSLTEAHNINGFNLGTICNVLKGNYKSSGGFTWKYKNPIHPHY